MGTRLGSVAISTHPFLAFCHESEVANHVCVINLRESWLVYGYHTEVTNFLLFPKLLLLCIVIFVLAQCESVKAQHGILLRTHHLSRRNSQCYSLDQ